METIIKNWYEIYLDFKAKNKNSTNKVTLLHYLEETYVGDWKSIHKKYTIYNYNETLAHRLHLPFINWLEKNYDAPLKLK
jgi:hypothetical protein